MSRKGFKIRWTCEWEKKKTSNIRENRVCLVLSVGSVVRVKGSIGNVASCDLDLHQVNKAIVVVAVAAARYGDASHARREVKLHRRSRRSPTAATTLPPFFTFNLPS